MSTRSLASMSNAKQYALRLYATKEWKEKLQGDVMIEFYDDTESVPAKIGGHEVTDGRLWEKCMREALKVFAPRHRSLREPI